MRELLERLCSLLNIGINRDKLSIEDRVKLHIQFYPEESRIKIILLIDDVVIVKKEAVVLSQTNYEVIEELSLRIIQEAFMCGIMTNKKFIEDNAWKS